MESGMDRCEKCRGKGYLLNRGVVYRCPKCFGRGEMDWIEKVVGINIQRGFPTNNQLYEMARKDLQEKWTLLEEK